MIEETCHSPPSTVGYITHRLPTLAHFLGAPYVTGHSESWYRILSHMPNCEPIPISVISPPGTSRTNGNWGPMRQWKCRFSPIHPAQTTFRWWKVLIAGCMTGKCSRSSVLGEPRKHQFKNGQLLQLFGALCRGQFVSARGVHSCPPGILPIVLIALVEWIKLARGSI